MEINGFLMVLMMIRMKALTYRYFAGFLAVFIAITFGLSAEKITEGRWENNPYQSQKKNDTSIHFMDVKVESFFKPPEEYRNNNYHHKTHGANQRSKPFDDPKIDKKMQKRVYLLQIGDQLEISLYGNVDIDTKRVVRIEPSGYVSYLFIEPVYALGKSIDQLRKDIAESIKKIYPNIMVSINAISLIGDQYTVMGEVRGPGTKQIHGEMKVLDALGAAGGFPMHTYRGQLVDYADLDRAFLSRRGNYVPLDFNALIREGDISQNIYVRSGDYLYIPSLINKQVYVLGEVAQPLAYSYLRTASVMEALTWAGGPTILASDTIVVIRGSLNCPTPFILDWPRLRTSCCPDFLLQPGDIVYVPRDRYWEASEIVKAGIRAFVGAVASIGGEETFIKLVPDAAGTSSNAVFINSGVNVSVPSSLP